VILWHLGTAALLTYVTLGRRRIDYRFVLLGSVAPDLVDAVVGLAFDLEPSGRGIAHSLAAVAAVAVAILIATRGERRLGLFGVAVGWLLHLVADGMWQAPQTFYWPLFGSRFSAAPAEPYGWDVVAHPLDHLSTWGGELVGAAILAWFWVAFELGRADRLRRFAADGYLRP
jgi:inner membrane protein